MTWEREVRQGAKGRRSKYGAEVGFEKRRDANEQCPCISSQRKVRRKGKAEWEITVTHDTFW